MKTWLPKSGKVITRRNCICLENERHVRGWRRRHLASTNLHISNDERLSISHKKNETKRLRGKCHSFRARIYISETLLRPGSWKATCSCWLYEFLFISRVLYSSAVIFFRKFDTFFSAFFLFFTRRVVGPEVFFSHAAWIMTEERDEMGPCVIEKEASIDNRREAKK